MQRWMAGGVALGFACAVLAGPAAAQTDDSDDPYADYDDVYFDDDGDLDEADGDDGDPWKKMNRAIFSFNEGLDSWVLGPVARGWNFLVPHPVQNSLRLVYENARFPIRLTNELLQGKPDAAGVSTARFLLNTTVGIGGFLDPASTIGLTASNEDFGQTLGVWGVPTGPYLVLPLLGPSSVRDGVGLAADTGLNVVGYFIPIYASTGLIVLNSVNLRAMADEQLEAERAAAIDFYEAVRSAYTQYREGLVQDRGDVTPGAYGVVFGGRRETQE